MAASVGLLRIVVFGRVLYPAVNRLGKHYKYLEQVPFISTMLCCCLHPLLWVIFLHHSVDTPETDNGNSS